MQNVKAYSRSPDANEHKLCLAWKRLRISHTHQIDGNLNLEHLELKKHENQFLVLKFCLFKANILSITPPNPSHRMSSSGSNKARRRKPYTILRCVSITW